MLVIIMQLSVVDKNTPENITFATFHQCRLVHLKCCVWLSCAETIYFLYLDQFDLLEFQRFCFQRSSSYSFNTSSFCYEYRIKHCREFITGQKFLFSFSSHLLLYIEGVEATFGLWSFLVIFTKQPTNSGLKIEKWLD